MGPTGRPLLNRLAEMHDHGIKDGRAVGQAAPNAGLKRFRLFISHEGTRTQRNEKVILEICVGATRPEGAERGQVTLVRRHAIDQGVRDTLYVVIVEKQILSRLSIGPNHLTKDM